MAFKKPAAHQPAAGRQPTQLDHDIHEALANLLGQHNIGQWASDHAQEGKSFQGWNYLAIAAIGRQAARSHEPRRCPPSLTLQLLQPTRHLVSSPPLLAAVKRGRC